LLFNFKWLQNHTSDFGQLPVRPTIKEGGAVNVTFVTDGNVKTVNQRLIVYE